MSVDSEQITDLLRTGVREQVMPAATWLAGGAHGPDAGGHAGTLDPGDPSHPAQDATIWDIASLTKITAVWAVIGTLHEDGKLDLDAPLSDLLPEISHSPLGAVTARHLLTHTAGLPPRSQLRALYGTDPEQIRRGVLHEDLHAAPGTEVVYTDRAALILGFLAEALTSTVLDELAHDRVWQPLGMAQTRFGPLPQDLIEHTAPTEFDEHSGQHLRGVAHDFSARLLGGVCGIAGAFAPAQDLGRFLAHMLAPRSRATFGPGWVEQSLRVQTAGLEPARGLFWHPAPGTDAGEDVWVHYGFTGTAMWISPTRGRWAVLMTNKIYYTRERAPITRLRDTFRTCAL